MRNALCFLLYLAMLSPGFTHMAQAADPAYVVSYLEAMPGARDRTADLIRQFARTSRKDAGNVRFEILSQIGRPGLFAILETWEDSQAQTAHAEAPHTKEFRNQIQPLLRAPYDERPHHVLSVGSGPAARAAGGTGAIYVVTHVDVPGKFQAEGADAVKQLSEASRGDKGNLRFDGLTQTSRPNHATMVEVWKDLKSVDAHVMAAHTKLFREKLHPMSGSLYDERLYRAMK
jgi:quinol monooxygenase YgiN